MRGRRPPPPAPPAAAISRLRGLTRNPKNRPKAAGTVGENRQQPDRDTMQTPDHAQTPEMTYQPAQAAAGGTPESGAEAAIENRLAGIHSATGPIYQAWASEEENRMLNS